MNFDEQTLIDVTVFVLHKYPMPNTKLSTHTQHLSDTNKIDFVLASFQVHVQNGLIPLHELDQFDVLIYLISTECVTQVISFYQRAF